VQTNFDYQELLKKDPKEKWDLLNTVRISVQACSMCPDLVVSRQLYPYGKPTFGFGNPNSPIFFIGEAPGKYGCGTTGIPFTRDRSGEYFQRVLREELGLNFSDIWITNIVKCCPLDNRTPTDEERFNCFPYLALELSIIQPFLVVPLGLSASKVIFPGIEKFGEVRARDISSRTHQIRGAKIPHYYEIYPVWHPAAVLRSPGLEERYRACFRAMEKLTLNSIATGLASLARGRSEDEILYPQTTPYRAQDLGDNDRDLY